MATMKQGQTLLLKKQTLTWTWNMLAWVWWTESVSKEYLINEAKKNFTCAQLAWILGLYFGAVKLNASTLLDFADICTVDRKMYDQFPGDNVYVSCYLCTEWIRSSSLLQPGRKLRFGKLQITIQAATARENLEQYVSVSSPSDDPDNSDSVPKRCQQYYHPNAASWESKDSTAKKYRRAFW